MLWFTIWFMVILKIPALYLAYVIWWAVKDPPETHALPALATGASPPDDGGLGWRRRQTRRDRPSTGPHGSPLRRPRTGAPARAQARR
jgi:hypothetical protein